MHFTYVEPNKKELNQGDLIKRTPEVEELLRDVHPHYSIKQDNKYFIVLTQSCDLVIRNNERCKSRYITLAAVRPLYNVLQHELMKYQYDPIERELNFVSKKQEPKFVQFMERLYNNNEDNYFFLYREPEYGLNEECCAILKLSIAVKSDLHYQTLLNAKFLELNVPFQHKLGYLVGMMYSRVGTDDWPQDDTFSNKTKEPLNDENLVLWLEHEIHIKLLRELKKKSPEERTVETLLELVKKHKDARESNKNKVLEIINQTLSEYSIEDKMIPIIIKRLENNPSFRGYLK